MTNKTGSKSEYPEHDKLDKVKDDSQVAGSFLEWLRNKYYICELNPHAENLYPISLSIQEILAEYFKIDLNKLEDEKLEMLNRIRAQDAD